MSQSNRRKFLKQQQQQQKQQQQQQQKNEKQKKEKKNKKRDRSSDDEGFITENRPTKKSQRETSTPPPSTSNMFEVLTTGDLNNVDMGDSITKKVRRPPPFIMPKPEPGKLAAFTGTFIKKYGPQVNFRISGDSLYIFASDDKTYSSLREDLTRINVAYFTYARQSSKPKRMVVKGIDRSIPTQDLETALQNQGLNVEKVFKMTKSTKTGEKIDLDMFQVNFKHDVKIEDVMSTEYVCHYRVKWQKFNKRDIGTQCRRCQRFGHSASSCNMQYRCVKCTEKHGPGGCEKKVGTLATCINCNGSHTANYRNCSTYKSYVSRIAPNKPSTPPGFRKVSPVARTPQSFVREGLSYASAASPPKQVQTPRPVTVLPPPTRSSSEEYRFEGGSIFAEMEAIFKCPVATIVARALDLKPQLQKCSSQAEKALVYTQFVFQCLGI